MGTNQSYKRTVAGSVGAGVDAILSSSGRPYYILEHKTQSKYHDVGESQKIIIDQIEMGRDTSCQVRWEDTPQFEMVSRKHAAIVRDGQNWQLVHLSTSNPTLVNGSPIQGTYYLQSGDEIQLANGGPRLGFIIPQGKDSTTSSIKLTERMNLFREQALRPYRYALWGLLAFLLLVILGFVTWSYFQQKNSSEYSALQQEQINELKDKNAEQEMKKLEEMEAEEAAKLPKISIRDYYDDVYTLKIRRISVEYQGRSIDPQISLNDVACGTGFLLNNGAFVTARQNVEPWMFAKNSGIDQDYWWVLRQYAAVGCDIIIEYDAYSTAGTAAKLSFNNKDFIVDRSGDDAAGSVEIENRVMNVLKSHGIKVEYVNKRYRPLPIFSPASSGFAKLPGVAKKGIPFNADASLTSEGGAEMQIVGFTGTTDIHDLNPEYFNTNTSHTDTNNGTIILQSAPNNPRGYLGSPVFIKDEEGRYQLVGMYIGSIYGYSRVVPVARFN